MGQILSVYKNLELKIQNRREHQDSRGLPRKSEVLEFCGSSSSSLFLLYYYFKVNPSKIRIFLSFTFSECGD